MRVTGLEEIKRHLKEVPKKLAEDVLNAAARAAAAQFAKKARELCTSADVRKTIRVIRMAGRIATEQFTYIVSAGGKGKGRVAHLIEFGTEPHVIRPDLKWRKRRAAGGKRIQVGERSVLKLPKGFVSWKRKKGPLQHPGTDPRAFMRPAFDREQQRAIDAYVRTARRLMHKLAKKGVLTGSYWEVVNT
jgi:HK97 gp10 family phage protein